MPAGDPRHRGIGPAKPGPKPHLGMRESLGQNRRGTPTGERALRRVRASPQGEAGRPASVGVLLPLIAGSESKRFAAGRAPHPIVMPPAISTPGHPTKIGTVASFLGMACLKTRTRKKARRESGSALLSS